MTGAKRQNPTRGKKWNTLSLEIVPNCLYHLFFCNQNRRTKLFTFPLQDYCLKVLPDPPVPHRVEHHTWEGYNNGKGRSYSNHEARIGWAHAESSLVEDLVHVGEHSLSLCKAEEVLDMVAKTTWSRRMEHCLARWKTRYLIRLSNADTLHFVQDREEVVGRCHSLHPAQRNEPALPIKVDNVKSTQFL